MIKKLILVTLIAPLSVNAAITLDGISYNPQADFFNNNITAQLPAGSKLELSDPADTITLSAPNNNGYFVIETDLNFTTTIINKGTINDTRDPGSLPMFDIGGVLANDSFNIVFENSGIISSTNNTVINNFNNDTFKNLTIKQLDGNFGNIEFTNSISTLTLEMSGGEFDSIITSSNAVNNYNISGGTLKSINRQRNSATGNPDVMNISGTGKVESFTTGNRNPNIEININGGELVNFTGSPSAGSVVNINLTSGKLSGVISDNNTGSENYNINIKSNYTLDSGDTINFRNLNVQNNSIFTFEDISSEFKVKNTTVDSGSTFNINKAFTSSDSFNNNGTVGLKAGLTGSIVNNNRLIIISDSTVTGDLTQAAAGTLQCNVTAGVPTKLTVTGACNLNNSNLFVNIISGEDNISPDDSFTVLTAGSPVQNANLSVTTNASNLRFKALTSGNDLNIIAEAGASLVTEANPTNTGVATTLTSLVDGGQASADLQNVVSVIQSLPEDQINSALNQISAESKTGVTEGIVEQLNQEVSGMTSDRSPSNVFNLSQDYAYRVLKYPQDFAKHNKGKWGQFFGNYYTFKPTADYNAYRSKTGGLVAGYDVIATSERRVGIAGSFSQSNISTYEPGVLKSTVNSYQLVGYGLSQTNNFTSDLVGAIALNRISNERGISFGSINRVATSSYYGYGLNLSGQFGYIFQRKDTILKPLGVFSLSYISNNSYIESGADSLNLNVQKKNEFYTKLGAGGELAHNIYFENSSLITSFKYLLVGNFNKLQQNLTAAFINTTPTFITPSQKLTRMENLFSLKFKYISRFNIESSLSYTFVKRKYITSQLALLEIRYIF